MEKQTAVEWLQDQYDKCPESFLTEDDFEQAKEMEKQQIKDAHCDGQYPFENIHNAEQYYKQTYNQ